MQPDLFETLDTCLTSLLEVRPVRTYRLPAHLAGVLMERGLGCSGRRYGSSSRCDLAGHALRTALISELGGMTRLRGRWRREATPAGRLWWVLDMLGPTIGEGEFGLLLPTPSVYDYGSNHGGAAGRTGPVRPSLATMILTPTAKGNMDAPAMAKWRGAWTDLLPTKRDTRLDQASPATMAKNSRPLSEVSGQLGLVGTVGSPVLRRRALLLGLVEWMQGFPPGHVTGPLRLTEMPLFRRLRRRSGGR